MAERLTTPGRVLLLLSLVPYLIEHGPTSVATLSQHFRVEERMIRRLVSFLGVAGVPGETLSYQHEDLFDIDWELFERRDVVALTNVVAVDDTPRFSTAETASLIAGLHALTPMLPASMREAADRAAAKLASLEAVDTRRPSVSVSVDPQDPRLTAITASLEAGRRLAFDYRDASGARSARRVDPLLLEQSGDTWYLRAFCEDRGAERTFVVERMRSLRQLDEEATHPAESVARVAPPGPGEMAVVAALRLRLDALHRISDFAPHVIGESSAGWVRAEVELRHPAVAVRLVQRALGAVVVEAPAAARAAVREWSERALSQYDA